MGADGRGQGEGGWGKEGKGGRGSEYMAEGVHG